MKFDIVYAMYLFFFLLLVGTRLELVSESNLLLGCLSLLAIGVIVLIKDYKRPVESWAVALWELIQFYRDPVIGALFVVVAIIGFYLFIDFTISPSDRTEWLSPKDPVEVSVVYPDKINIDGEDILKLRVRLKEDSSPRNVKVTLTAKNSVAHLNKDALFVATTTLSETRPLREWYIPFDYDRPCNMTDMLIRDTCTNTNIGINAKVDQDIELKPNKPIEIRVVNFPREILSTGSFFVLVVTIMNFWRDIQKFIKNALSSL